MARNSQSQTWLDVVKDTLVELGGEAHLSEINARLDGHPKTATNPTWRDTIRKVVRQYSAFEPVPPERSGRYRLAEKPAVVVSAQVLDAVEPAITHGIAQGMLVTLGKTYGYETFVPKADQTTRSFQDRPLADIVSVRDVSEVFTSANLRQVALIDVLWMEEDEDGLFPVAAFEVEHTTRITQGLNRLLKIPRRYPVDLFVVGPSETEEQLFQQRVAQTPFREHRDRFLFRRYAQLEGLFNAAVAHERARFEFGVNERWAARGGRGEPR